MKFRLSPYIAALSAATVVLAGVRLLDLSEQQRFRQRNHTDALQQLSTVRAKLESGLNSRLVVGRGLAAYTSIYPDIAETEFTNLASEILAEQTGIRLVSLSQGTTVRSLYPLKGNREILGKDLKKHPQHWEATQQAIATRTTVVAGPMDWPTGEEAVISCTPIFLKPQGGLAEKDRYWGVVDVAIDPNILFQEAGILPTLDRSGQSQPIGRPNLSSIPRLSYAIRGKDDRGKTGEVFFGDRSIFDRNPIVLEISLPNGSWQLAALPIGDWPQHSPFRMWRLAGGGLVAILAGFFAFKWVRDPQKMRENEAKYRELVENANSIILKIDTFGNITFFNEFAQHFFGYSEEEILGKNAIGKILPATDASGHSLFEKLQGQIEPNTPSISSESEYIRRKGGRGWIAWRNKALRDSRGRLTGMLCIGTDISDRKRAEIALRTSEAELRALFAAMNDVIFVIDSEGRYLKIAPTNPDLLYKPPLELLGKRLIDVLPPATAEVLLSHIRQALETKQTCSLEYSAVISDKEIWFAANVSPLLDDTAIWVARDITERKQAEKALQKANEELEIRVAERTAQLQKALEQLQNEIRERELTEEELRQSEERWQLALKGNNDGIWDANLRTQEVFYSPRWIEMLGYEESEISNHQTEVMSRIHPEDYNAVIAAMQDHLSGQTPYYVAEFRLRCKDGSYKWILSRAQALWDEEGNPVRMVGSDTDITERKQAEEALRQSEERWQLALKGNNDGIWDINLKTKTAFASVRCKEMLGYAEHEIDNNLEAWTALIHPDDRDLVMQTFQDHLARKTPHYILEYRRRCKDGTYKWFLDRGQAVWDEDGNPVRIVGSHTDITERKQAEEALRQSEMRERERAQQLEEALQELRSTQSQLIQTEKMSSLGQLVAGVAHEINNPVNFIHGNLTYASDYVQSLLSLIELYQQEYPQPNDKVLSYMEEIELDFISQDLEKIMASMKVGTERIRKIVLSLRNFSRLDESDMKPVDIHEGLDNTLLILQHRLKGHNGYPDIEVIKDYGQFSLIECYAGQLNQVFMNLISNGIDAIDYRLHKLSLEEVQANPGRLVLRTQIVDRDTVQIEISDNGTGMSESVKEKIFNPFFTTKPVGKGTGLGMSIVHSIIVEKHRGKIDCISQLGQGTTFQVRIPIQQVKAF